MSARRRAFGGSAAAVALSGLCSCAGFSHQGPRSVPSFYKSTRDQVGHEFVKTEQFVVPVGTRIGVRGLEFDTPACVLSDLQKQILTQVFNSLEEITENTVNDTDAARVARFRQVKFEVRGYSARHNDPPQNAAEAKQCAEVVMRYILSLGTPPDHLQAAGSTWQSVEPGKAPLAPWIVEFVRAY